MELTAGTLLGGRVRYTQPRDAYRTGIEPVLLAASIPVRPGEHVIEAGTGAGAAMLCLLARVPDATVAGLEADAAMAALAASNLQDNGMHRGSAVHADILSPSDGTLFDHAMANPPWHDARGTASPELRRDLAKRARPGLLAAWIESLAARLQPRGTLTLALPAACLAEGAAALVSAGFGDMALLPLWPRTGQPARLILLRGVRGSHGVSRLLPGLTLHEGDGYTEAARAVLWDGAALPFT